MMCCTQDFNQLASKSSMMWRSTLLLLCLMLIAHRDLHPRDGKYGHAAMFPMQAPAMFPAAQGPKKLISVGALVRS